jgi:hypothetical protein
VQQLGHLLPQVVIAAAFTLQEGRPFLVREGDGLIEQDADPAPALLF